MLLRLLINLDPKAKIHFIEPYIRLLVLAGCGRAHGKQGALRHAWYRKEGSFALRASAESPGAGGMLLSKEIGNGGVVGDCE
jgi:hypothetical protein